jgi:hypothetical protein
VLVKDINGGPESEREEEDADEIEAGPSAAGQKIKSPDAMEVTLPYLSDAVIFVEDMLGKVPKLRYTDYDVRDAAKFPMKLI